MASAIDLHWTDPTDLQVGWISPRSIQLRITARGNLLCLHGTVCQYLMICSLTKAVFGYQIQNSKKKIRHLHGDLNLDEIKNALRLLSVNGETNLMNLIRL